VEEGVLANAKLSPLCKSLYLEDSENIEIYEQKSLLRMRPSFVHTTVLRATNKKRKERTRAKPGICKPISVH